MCSVSSEPEEQLVFHHGDSDNYLFWGGGLIGPEEFDCMVAISVGQRVYHNNDAEFGVKLVVGRLPANPQGLVREPIVLFADTRRVPLGSVLVDGAIDELRLGLYAELDHTLQEVARRLALPQSQPSD